jgi:peptide/nickel transport system permease protein
MLSYSLKRVLLLLPTLWLISSVIFFLSKMLPGTTGFDQDRESSLGEAGYLAKQKVYQQYVQRTGLNLPLFYFSIRSRVEPDTLSRVSAQKDKQSLHRLSLQHGNWPLIADFYQQYQALRHQINTLPNTPQRTGWIKLLDGFMDKSAYPEAVADLEHLQAQLNSAFPNPVLARQVEFTAGSFRQISLNKVNLLQQVPVIFWHGRENQYHSWFSKLLQGSLGTSLRDERQVTAVISEALANTFWLMGTSFILIFVIAIELSIRLNQQRYKKWTSLIFGILYVLDSIPLFVIGLTMLILFVGTSFFPNQPLGGLFGDFDSALSGLEMILWKISYLFLPLLCLTLARLPYITGQIFRSLQEALFSSYSLTARSKGVSESTILRKHSLRNVLLPIITLTSDFLPSLVAGALIIEVIFSIPGIGRLLTDSVMARDYPVIIGIVLLVALVKMGAHILADVFYFLADPRLKKEA